MKQKGGVWYPDYDEHFWRFHPGELERDIPFFLKHVPGRTRVIQAGGAMGLYPVALAQHFQQVVTFEPDPFNWECLEANRRARDSLNRVLPIRGGLSDKCGSGSMDRPDPRNCGANRVVEGNDFPVFTIDGFVFHREGPDSDPRAKGHKVDAIWLDIEGLELAALKGAERLIRAQGPVIVTEENGNGARYGVGPCDIEDWLETLGYEIIGGIGRDRYYARTA